MMAGILIQFHVYERPTYAYKTSTIVHEDGIYNHYTGIKTFTILYMAIGAAVMVFLCWENVMLMHLSVVVPPPPPTQWVPGDLHLFLSS